MDDVLVSSAGEAEALRAEDLTAAEASSAEASAAEAEGAIDDLPLGFSISLFKLNSSDSGLGQSTPPGESPPEVCVQVHHGAGSQRNGAGNGAGRNGAGSDGAGDADALSRSLDVAVSDDADSCDFESDVTYGYF